MRVYGNVQYSWDFVFIKKMCNFAKVMENNYKNTIFETWKPIKGFEGLYEVSDQGRIKSLDRIIIDENGGRKRLFKGKILKPHNRPDNYQEVHLVGNGNNNFYSIHRLVAEAFIPNPDNKPEVDHLNTDRKDCRVENLRWCTRKENMKNKHTLTRMLDSKKGKSCSPIIQYSTYDNQPIAWWNSIADCSRFTGITPTRIRSTIIGHTKTVCNKEFYFKYAE